MLLVSLGHGRKDIRYDSDTKTDDQVQWTNVGPKRIKVELIDHCVGRSRQFTLEPGESHLGYVGSVMNIIEIKSE